MTNITFTIPSVLNAGSGEKKIDVEANTLRDAFEKIANTMGDDFKRRVLNDDGRIDRDETTVCYVTCNGLKATESLMEVLPKPQLMQPDIAKISAVVK